MRIGIQLPQWGELATRAAVVRIARAAEDAGFDSVWVSDHVVYPLEGEANYPQSADGSPPFKAEEGYLEAIAMLGVVAGATERVGLGTSVLVLPMRNLLLTAKSLATLDVLSGGRVSIAVATGWWTAEFEALGADFAKRGTVLDQQLKAVAELWSLGRAKADGDGVKFPLVVSEPRPIQAGGPPIWVGGEGPRVWRRIARSIAVGWHGVGYKAAAFDAARDGITAACRESGRDPAGVRLSTATGMPAAPDRLLGRIQALVDAGLSQVVFIPRSDSLEAVLEAIEMFGTQVRPRLSSLTATSD
jgi:probable F420-dependent oxidoreductase